MAGSRTSIRASVPGRVCLAGEHVDWMSGRVATLAIDLYTTVEATTTATTGITATYTQGFVGEQWSPGQAVDGWLHSVVDTLLSHGIEVPGCALVVTGTLPTSGGLASSAALCLGITSALTALADAPVSEEQLAEYALEAERSRGILCGPMDQYGIVSGGLSLLHCKTAPPAVECREWPEHLRVVVGTSLQSCALRSVLPALLDRYARQDPDLAAYVSLCGSLIERFPAEASVADVVGLVTEGHALADRFLGPFDPTITRAMEAARRSGALCVKTSGARHRGGSCFAVCTEDRVSDVARSMSSAGVTVQVASAAAGLERD